MNSGEPNASRLPSAVMPLPPAAAFAALAAPHSNIMNSGQPNASRLPPAVMPLPRVAANAAANTAAPMEGTNLLSSPSPFPPSSPSLPHLVGLQESQGSEWLPSTPLEENVHVLPSSAAKSSTAKSSTDKLRKRQKIQAAIDLQQKKLNALYGLQLNNDKKQKAMIQQVMKTVMMDAVMTQKKFNAMKQPAMKKHGLMGKRGSMGKRGLMGKHLTSQKHGGSRHHKKLNKNKTRKHIKRNAAIRSTKTRSASRRLRRVLRRAHPTRKAAARARH